MFPTEITCFLSVARTRSISDSAKELYLTRQAVSKNIQELENSLGLCLFHREQSAITLTVAGQMMVRFYTTSDYTLDGVKRIYGHPPQNSLRIGWGGWLLPENELLDCLKEFSDRFDVNLQVVHAQEQELPEYLRTGEIEVMFASRYLSTFLREPCTVFHISEEPIYLGISASHPMAEAPVASLVASLPFLTCPACEASEEEIIGRVSRELLAFPRPAPQIRVLPNVQTVFLQVMLGNGVSASPAADLYGYGIRTVPFGRTASMSLVNLNRCTNANLPLLRAWLSEHYPPRTAGIDSSGAGCVKGP